MSIHWRVRESVLGSVGDAGNHSETSQAPSCLLSWMDRVLLLSLLTHQWWEAEAAVAAASAPAWAATPRAHQGLLSPADGASRSGREVVGAASAYVGTHSGRTTAHCFEC